MSFRMPRPIIKRIWRAVIEFDLLFEGDRVLIGVSGGKDSAFLLRAMKVIADTAPFHIDLGAIYDLDLKETIWRISQGSVKAGLSFD